MFRRRRSRTNENSKEDAKSIDSNDRKFSNGASSVSEEHGKQLDSKAADGKKSDWKCSVDSSEDSDPDAALKNIQNFKGDNDESDPTKLRGSLNRYNEFASYSNRSERIHARPDPTPSLADLAKRKVKVDENVTVHTEKDSWTDAELKSYFMQEEDFRRCDADVELTTYRWEKHRKSKMPFDDKQNTIRGLEEIICYNQKRDACRNKHLQDVLTETRKQRLKGKTELDWEKIRDIAIKTSNEASKHARHVGEEDEKDARSSHGLSSSSRFASYNKAQRSSSRGENSRRSVGKIRMMLSFKGNKS
ncbi:hypothetical protein ACA910_005022 [Epithemia clementina (nom. ined.)]